MSEPIEVNGPWDDDPGGAPEGGAAWNRAPGKTAAEVNLDGAPYGFKVTGDAAWDPGSDDYAMFSEAGNQAVAAMVKTGRLKTRGGTEAEVAVWVEGEKARLALAGMSEVYDTMVRETVAYALDEAWLAAYGHRFGEG